MLYANIDFKVTVKSNKDEQFYKSLNVSGKVAVYLSSSIEAWLSGLFKAKNCLWRSDVLNIQVSVL